MEKFVKSDYSIDNKLNTRNLAFKNTQKESDNFLYSGAVPPGPPKYEYSGN